jgi:hypothetical protein
MPSTIVDERRAGRQDRAVPLLAEFRACLDSGCADCLPKSPIGQAAICTLSSAYGRPSVVSVLSVKSVVRTIRLTAWITDFGVVTARCFKRLIWLFRECLHDLLASSLHFLY